MVYVCVIYAHACTVAVVANIHVRVQVEARGRCWMLLLVESWMLSDRKELELF